MVSGPACGERQLYFKVKDARRYAPNKNKWLFFVRSHKTDFMVSGPAWGERQLYFEVKVKEARR